MNKKQKRELGEARQAAFLQQNIESGLKAQKQAHEIVAKRKATAEKIAKQKKLAEDAKKAGEKMKQVGFSASTASKSINDLVEVMATEELLEDEFPEVLDMTDETAYSA